MHDDRPLEALLLFQLGGASAIAPRLARSIGVLIIGYNAAHGAIAARYFFVTRIVADTLGAAVTAWAVILT